VGFSSWSPLRDLVSIRPDSLPGRNSRLLAVEGTCLWRGDQKPESTDIRFSLVAFAYRTLARLYRVSGSKSTYLA
jgi:hypothetical protein